MTRIPQRHCSSYRDRSAPAGRVDSTLPDSGDMDADVHAHLDRRRLRFARRRVIAPLRATRGPLRPRLQVQVRRRPSFVGWVPLQSYG